MRQFLEELGLESFVKTTGGKGLHLVVPIERRNDWTEVKAFCKEVADTIVALDPSNYTAKMSKAARPGKSSLTIYAMAAAPRPLPRIRRARGPGPLYPRRWPGRNSLPESIPTNSQSGTWRNV